MESVFGCLITAAAFIMGYFIIDRFTGFLFELRGNTRRTHKKKT